MSEFLAEARVIVRPDTTGFRATLQESVNRAIAQAKIAPLQVPIVLGAAQGLAAVAATTSALSAAQERATKSTVDLATAARLENTAFGRQAVILQGVTVATQQKAGADSVAAAAARSHTAAQSQVGKAAVASTAGMLGLRGAVLTAGTAFIAATVGFQALGKAISSAVSFERELNVFQITAGATADQMERVSQVSRELGRDITLPGVAANDAAQTLSLLARAGLSVEDSLNAVRGTLQLATAAEIENAKAAELVANALNSFKLDGTEATRVADLLAGAANASQGSIEDMGLALKQTSAIASGLGISVEDTVTILTQLSRAGLSASDAGTSFRQTLLRLIQDLPKVDAEVEKLGLDLRDLNGNIRPEVFEELGQKLKKLTPASRQLAIANLGGADAIRTLLILTRAQAGEFDAVEASITRAGLAQELAGARTKGLGGDVEGAKNQFAELGLTVGRAASGPLSLFVRTAGAAAGAVNELNREFEESTGGGGFLSTFGDAVNDFAGSFSRLNFQFQQGVRAAALGRKEFSAFGAITETVTESIEGLNAALRETSAELGRQRFPGAVDEGIGVQGILNRVQGFDSAEVRARIRGDNSELLSVLEQEQAFLEEQLDRKFVKRRGGLQRQLEQALLGVVNDVTSIQKQGATATKSAADDAVRAQREADQALLDRLSNRREDLERAGDRAETEGRLGDAIRSENRLQALLKKQIQKIRDQISDEKEKKAAVRELRLALIASRQEEDALRQQRRQEAQERLQEAQERLREASATRLASIGLDVELADINENTKRRIALRQKLIQQLLKERKTLKLTGNALKENRNEIARINAEIAGIKGESKKTGDGFAELAFDFMQKQQGFAANLLGNLIPSSATAGLVGGTTPDPGAQLKAQAAFKASGPTFGQAATEVDILKQVLQVLREIRAGRSHPEARYQRDTSNSNMDGVGGV